MDERPTRRAFLLGAASAAGLAALAGCPAGGERVTPAGTPRPALDAAVEFGAWFGPTANFDGRVADARGETEPTVLVGASGNGGYRAYAPPALAVDIGTTVVWEWSGRGGSHDVVGVDGDFRSGLVAESGYAFRHTFRTPGIYEYYCTPHRRVGMKGAIVVRPGATTAEA